MNGVTSTLIKYPIKTAEEWDEAARIWISACLEWRMTQRQVADMLGLATSAHISRLVREGHISPTLRRALIKEKIMPERPPDRCRINGDVPPRVKAEILAEAARNSLTAGEMIHLLWAYYQGEMKE